MSTHRTQLALSSDEGMGLVELIVYISIAVLATLGIATLFSSGLSANAATKDRDTATGKAQAISISLQTGIRNASDFVVADNLLRARVATGASDWKCEAWAITPSGTFVHHTSTTAIGTDPSGWTVLADKAQGTLTGGQAFAKSTNRLEARFELIVGDSVVPITTDAVAQAKGEGDPATCW